MKKLIFFLFINLTSSTFAALNTEISCEMKRDDWDKMSFYFRFLTPRKVISNFHFQRSGEISGNQRIPVTAIHQSSEARYVGINFLGDEKLVFIFLTPIFATENIGIPFEIEVVSSIYGPLFLKCKANK